MNFSTTVSGEELYGTTTAYGVTHEMVDKELTFDSWDIAQFAFENEFDSANERMIYGEIHTNGLCGGDIIIEGLLPPQDSHRSYPVHDMAYFLVEQLHKATKQQEIVFIKGGHTLDGTINMTGYIQSSLEQVFLAAIEDNKSWELIGSSEADILEMITNTGIDMNSINTGTSTLDYFERHAAIMEVFDFQFWLILAEQAEKLVLVIIENALLELAALTGMGRIVCNRDNHLIIKDSGQTGSRYQDIFGDSTSTS